MEPQSFLASAPERHRAFSGRRALVMGLGRFGGGAGAARYLVGLGARVRITDTRPAQALESTLAGLRDLPVEFALGGHRAADFEEAEIVVVNPAVRRDNPFLQVAQGGQAEVTSEIELFLEAVRARVVAITGTQGKSSTSHMTHRLLSLSGRRAHLGGNIGGSLLPSLPTIRRDDIVVLELSSYQLEGLGPERNAARLEAVAVVNLMADHLERHGTLEAYSAAKRRILELLRPGGHGILPRDDERFSTWEVEGTRHDFSIRDTGEGLFLREGLFRLDDEVLGRVDELAVPGQFQRANALVALGLARLMGATPTELAKALPGVRGLEHRLQDLGWVRGRRVIDNAVSTTPDSTLSALLALPTGTVLVLGGLAKRLPLEDLARVARERVDHVMAFGQSGEAFGQVFRAEGVPVEVVETVEQAVTRAFERGQTGAHLLFSPAASSFDAYANFEERAVAFRAILDTLR